MNLYSVRTQSGGVRVILSRKFRKCMRYSRIGGPSANGWDQNEMRRSSRILQREATRFIQG